MKTQLVAIGGLALLLSACSYGTNLATLEGPMPTAPVTPYDEALACLKTHIPANSSAATYAVSELADRTGKYSIGDQGTGYWITQGAGDIMTNILKRKAGVRVVDRLRFNVVADELDLANKTMLGDEKPKTITLANGQSLTAPVVQVQRGSVLKSDYYIAGSINKFDFDIVSGGADVSISGIGPRYRQFRMEIGNDIRLVNSRTGEVVATSSVNKQIVGDDMGLGVGRFFGSRLVVADVGYQRTEPLQTFALQVMLTINAYDLLKQVNNIGLIDCDNIVAKAEGREPPYVVAAATPAPMPKPIEAAPAAKPAAVIAPAPKPEVVTPRAAPVIETPAPAVVQPTQEPGTNTVPGSTQCPPGRNFNC
jgi:curli biogenesis system outer membrane secretion channel CsgG